MFIEILLSKPYFRTRLLAPFDRHGFGGKRSLKRPITQDRAERLGVKSRGYAPAVFVSALARTAGALYQCRPSFVSNSSASSGPHVPA